MDQQPDNISATQFVIQRNQLLEDEIKELRLIEKVWLLQTHTRLAHSNIKDVATGLWPT